MHDRTPAEAPPSAAVLDAPDPLALERAIRAGRLSFVPFAEAAGELGLTVDQFRRFRTERGLAPPVQVRVAELVVELLPEREWEDNKRRLVVERNHSVAEAERAARRAEREASRAKRNAGGAS
jgi:hypothetical protein